MIDIVSHRKDLNKKIKDILDYLQEKLVKRVNNSNDILKRLELLHPKKIDLSLNRLYVLLKSLITLI